VFSFEDPRNVVLVPYAFELLRNTLNIRDIHRTERVFLFFLTTTTLRPDNRVNKTLGITIELKIKCQVVYLNQQVLFLACGGSSIMKAANNYSFEMWRVVRIEVKISASVGGVFLWIFVVRAVPFLVTRTSRKGNAPSDSISIVNWMDDLKLLRWVRKYRIKKLKKRRRPNKELWSHR
jgi:hypothetical protein